MMMMMMIISIILRLQKILKYIVIAEMDIKTEEIVQRICAECLAFSFLSLAMLKFQLFSSIAFEICVIFICNQCVL